MRSGVCFFVVFGLGHHRLGSMPNLESQLWTILANDFTKRPVRIAGPELLVWLRKKHGVAMEGFSDARIANALSKLATLPRSPIESFGRRRGYGLRESFDRTPPLFSSRRGRRSRGSATLIRQPSERVAIDVSQIWHDLSHGKRKGARVIGGHNEVRIAIAERGARQVRLNLEAMPDPRPTLPERKYFSGEFYDGAPGVRALVFEQRGEFEDGHFVPLFKAVLEELATPRYEARIGIQEFLDVIEAELHRIEKGRGSQLLTKEEQRGLIGELWFLDHIAIPKIGSAAAIEAWHGPKASPKDFWFDNGCLEVKASLANAGKVEISSIQQLETAGIKALFLLHLRMDQHAGKGGEGKTLPQYVKKVRDRLASEAKVLDLFEDRLWNSQEIGGGRQFRRYRDEDERRYKDRYYVREDDRAYYRVGPKFPKFSRAELESRGLDVASYSIALSYCGPAVSETVALQALGCSKGRRK